MSVGGEFVTTFTAGPGARFTWVCTVETDVEETMIRSVSGAMMAPSTYVLETCRLRWSIDCNMSFLDMLQGRALADGFVKLLGARSSMDTSMEMSMNVTEVTFSGECSGSRDRMITVLERLERFRNACET